MGSVLLTVFLIVYGLNLSFIAARKRYGYFITKLLLTPALYLFYLSRNEKHDLVVFLALFFSFFGDLFMEFSEKESFFIAGLTSFLIAHLFYIICFARQIKLEVWWPFLFIIPYAALAVSVYRVLNLQNKKIKTAVAIYCAIIFIMSFSAMLRGQSVSTAKFLLAFAGSLLFIASDTMIAYNTFNKKFKYAGFLIMATYGLAQLLIIAGI